MRNVCVRKLIWGKVGNKIAPIFLIAALAGCDLPSSMLAYIPTIPAIPALPALFALLPESGGGECAVVSPKALKQVNWARVPQVNMRIRNNEFEPMIVQMTQGWPYTFTIRNRDDKAHVFNAAKFLKSIATVRLTIDGRRQDNTCITRIIIPANATAEMQIVAAQDGHFEFEDNWLPPSSFISGGADGVIIIKERRTPRRN